MPNIRQVRFDNHEDFHRQVTRMTLAGAAIGLLGYLAHLAFGSVAVAGGFAELPAAGGAGALALVYMALVAAALGLAATPPVAGRRVVQVAAALGVALLGTLLMRALSSAPPVYPWLGVGLYGAAIGLIAGRGVVGARRYTVAAGVGATVALATWVALTLATRLPLVEYVPAFVAEPLYGAVFGFVASIGLALRQLRIERDLVAGAFDRLENAEGDARLSGEMLELCQRAKAIYQRVHEAVGEGKVGLRVQKLLLEVVALAERWQQIEREAARTSADALVGRIEQLEGKVAAADDAVARRQYVMARDALRAQLGYLRDIARSRERVVARVHSYLAALERLNLAVLNHQGADAAKFCDELAPILDEIDDLGSEIDIASETIAEVAAAQSDARAAATRLACEQDEPAGDPAGSESDEAPPPAKQVDQPVDAEASLTASAFK